MEFLIGIFVGGLLFWIFVDRKKPSGTFVIDLSDPLKDVFRIELSDSLEDMFFKKQIILNVKTYEDSSQK